MVVLPRSRRGGDQDGSAGIGHELKRPFVRSFLHVDAIQHLSVWLKSPLPLVRVGEFITAGNLVVFCFLLICQLV